MAKRTNLMEAIANTIQSYRKGEIPVPTVDHVDRWISQFTPENQLPMLQEFSDVIESSFITHESFVRFLGGLMNNAALTGKTPKDFWSKVNFLRVQKDGVSQRAMLKLMAVQLKDTFGLDLAKCGADDGDFMYLDDIMCTGSRVGNDIVDWIKNDAPKECRLHIVLAVTHTTGEYYLRNTRLENAKKEAGKQGIKITVWRALELENTVYWNRNADVYWPSELPNLETVKSYAANGKFPFKPRELGGKSKIFKSEEGRKILEAEFLLAGMKIRSHHSTPKDSLRPLGFGPFGIGFGSTLVTYRNCPNTAPLAVWWGDGGASNTALQWYPLLPRKTYSSAENVFSKCFD
ncbi:hypothetical protein D9M09_24345 [Janthinobacterium agaricidamnosum]|uniref:PRTase-CE domain-containing protein n=1 Tax=Janthinobacterium agaricidamnosum TaxID=55508 RepID=A0A3G2EFF8_9BURK|nr:hypothetical protein [Janthinobacterium agaricidamnosum]AYM78580.1 hypothetical protein D9M09_24345 [Janthinobacterium agaricidamnosum]